MTDKTKMIVGIFLIIFVAIGAGGLAWDRNLKMDQCDETERRITHLGNRIDDLFFGYGMYREINPNNQRRETFKKYIELKEPLAKKMIEDYAKACRSGYQKKILLIMLSQYSLYLRTKTLLFEESQAAEMLWLQGVSPHKDNLLLD